MIRVCPHCGKKNRVAALHLADDGRCGHCHAALPAVAAPLEVGDAELEDLRQHARVPLLVDFWASWCGPCRMAAPEVARLAEGMKGRALVVKVNTDEHPGAAARYGVRGIPNFIVLRGGEVVEQSAGVVPATVMQGWLERAGA